MGVGNSITAGGSFNTYLFPLREKLIDAGYDVTFIGPRVTKNRGSDSICHFAFGGKTAEFLDSAIDSVYTKYPADIVLIHAGHNHFDTEKPVQGIVNAQRSIINKLRRTNPDVKILVAQVITSGKLPKYSYIPELNESLTGMVADFNNKNIILVDQASGFDWEKHAVADMVHPNQEGAEIMADTWFNALTPILKKPRGK
jgi:lysophospholipase L1-like esterase